MERVVYFLGAGFSAPLGYPVMSNFLEISKDIYFKEPIKFNAFQKVFDDIANMSVGKNYYESNLFDIEEILSILEMKGTLESKFTSKLFKKYILDVINHFTPIIEKPKTLPGNWYDFAFGKNIHNLYGYFIGNILNIGLSHQNLHPKPDHIDNFNIIKLQSTEYNYSLITLNYDLVVESFVEYLNKNFKPGNLIVTGSPDKNDADLYYAKLHGSIDLDEIIAPTWNKILRKKIIRQNWKLAFNLLSEANHIRIIGYSLPITDSYIKYLFKSSVIKKRTPHLKSIDVITLDPDGSVKQRYDDFIHFHNYRFKSENFVKFLELNYDSTRKNFVKGEGSTGMTKIIFDNLEKAHEKFMET